MSQVRVSITLSALCLAIAGAMLLFAPDGVSRIVPPGTDGGLLAQLLGAALLGFAAMNWIARGSALGGIYGRAVVAANQTHLTIGALLLVTHGFKIGIAHPAYWVLAILYVLGAGYFVYLTFFSSGLPKG